jgi:hypothetical protein
MPERTPEERRAERMEPPPTGSLDRPGAPTPTTPGMPSPTPPSGTPGSPTIDQPAMQVMEKSASGDIKGFEKRLRTELEKDDMQLAATVDLQEDPPMRLLVIAPKKGEVMAAKKSGEMEGAGSMHGPGSMHGTMPESGTTPKPGSGEMPESGKLPESGKMPESGTTPKPGSMPESSKTPEPGKTPESGEMEASKTPGAMDDGTMAKAALEQVLVLVAYTEKGDTDRVRLAYFEHPEGHDMSTVDAAIDRATQDMADAPAG